MAKRSKELLEADTFRAHVQRLRSLPNADWNSWEADWLDKEAARSENYIYTDKERVILNRLIASATLFEAYNGWSISELITTAHHYYADLNENDEEFVEQLWESRPYKLRVRQLRQLVEIARLSEQVGRDDEVEQTLRETWIKDETLERGASGF